MRAFAVLLLAAPAFAAPREFPLTWTSLTTTAGQSQLEVWATPRIARTDDFLRLDTRLAWTHGVASNLDTQLSLDLDFQRTDRSDGVEGRLSSLWRWTTWRSGSPVAFGGVGRLSLGLDSLEVEARLLADWRFQRIWVALNASGSKLIFWNGRQGVDTRLEESLALSYQLSASASFGLEGRLKSSWQARDYQGTALYVGPTLTIRQPSFWVTLGTFAQVASERAPADRALAEPQELRDNERFVLRLAFGATTH